ncbi:DUF120 domain-containing protein [Halobacteriales archaeon Cl-PHB]
MQETSGRDLDHATVATLRELALLGAFDGETKLSCADLADRLDVSTQTASRRLQTLDDAGHVDREIVGDGQWVRLTDAGERRLEAEYAAYRRLFEDDVGVALTGTVTSGMGEGRHYIQLPGYARQFVTKLDYEPFPGTLNVDLVNESVRARSRLTSVDPIVIDGWEDDERTYGPAYCYTATVAAGDAIFEPAHVITPERTHHGEDQLEVIAPEKLRDVLELTDGEEVTVRVSE